MTDNMHAEKAVRIKRQSLPKCHPQDKDDHSTASQNLFVRLPAELRNTVYGMVLVPLLTSTMLPLTYGDGYRFSLSRGTSFEGTFVTVQNITPVDLRWHIGAVRTLERSIFSISRGIRQEVLPMYYAQCIFRIQLETTNLRRALAWLQNTIAILDPHEKKTALGFIKFQIVLHRRQWVHLQKINVATAPAKLVRLCFARSIPWFTPLSIVGKNTYPIVYLALAAIADLGAQAHDENWSEAQLSKHVQAVLDTFPWKLRTVRSKRMYGQMHDQLLDLLCETPLNPLRPGLEHIYSRTPLVTDFQFAPTRCQV